MKFSFLPFRDLEIEGGVVRTATPYILEYQETEEIVREFFSLYQKLINPQAQRLGSATREENAESYPIFGQERKIGDVHIIYDLEETRIVFELIEEEATKIYRLLREQRIVNPDLIEIRDMMSGNLAETVAGILWQIGAIKVSLGDLRPLFKVDENRNYSPIYIDVKGIFIYPSVSDFIVSTSALLIKNLDFDVVCGIEAGSIAITALLAQKLSRPMFFARREQKYPEAPALEGVKPHQLFRKKVLLVDDTLVHGWTKTRVIKILREWGAKVENCFVIFDRQQGGEEELHHLGVKLYSLTNRDAALSPKIPREVSYLTDIEFVEVTEYFRNPAKWHERKNLPFFPPRKY